MREHWTEGWPDILTVQVVHHLLELCTVQMFEGHKEISRFSIKRKCFQLC